MKKIYTKQRKETGKEPAESASVDALRKEAKNIPSPTAVDERTIKKSVRSFRILSLFLLISFSLVGLLLYWAFFPYDVLEVKSPVKILTKEIKPGDPVILSYDYCKYTNTEGRLVRFLVGDRSETLFPQVRETTEAGCVKNFKVPMYLPDGLPAGQYHIRFRVFYQVNPIKEVEEVFATQTFTVLER